MFSKKIADETEFKTLSECPLFMGLSKGELKSVLGISHIREYSADEKIFNEGTVGLCFYIIVKGSAVIVDDASADEKPHVLKTYIQSDYFSETHLFSETYHTVSCVAREVTKLIIFTKPDFEDLVKINPGTGNKLLMNFLHFIGDRLEELYRQNTELLKQVTEKP